MKELGMGLIVAGFVLLEVGTAGLLGWAERDGGLFFLTLLVEIGITTVFLLLVVGSTLVDA